MKIAVTAEKPTLDSQLDPRFGRCAYFLIVDLDDGSFEAMENPNLELGGGVGIQSGQMMANKGVRTIITGNCGPNAYKVLTAGGVDIIVGCSGIVRDVIEDFKAGRLSSSKQPNVEGHYDPSAGAGRGLGGGRGGGRGRGLGGGGRRR
ncbi:MAG: NifB/NifX family molybdenum-iron cluster-binding protein [Proteobacteria bacterium]|nr:NifB/NifX family molybdenum-iron cluster-binding protein [Pseudomonadota bacterium]